MYDAKLLENEENNEASLLKSDSICDLCYFEKYPGERLFYTKSLHVPIDGLLNKDSQWKHLIKIARTFMSWQFGFIYKFL